ncbi:unnamed protein product [Rangifer tarandus platyrhynchus]|uniref:Uncharacterized protein n=2 Tax=Rangifer tarandus platyrhynchus TaxID=3082113 RepID=A0ACB0FH01_RANTA|nr:unnamed protein product [Rangifer tarandus platyrhynchus]CAI9712181.1 unnamed protein product [Rangifer tarandus platyrhynchus]
MRSPPRLGRGARARRRVRHGQASEARTAEPSEVRRPSPAGPAAPPGRGGGAGGGGRRPGALFAARSLGRSLPRGPARAAPRTAGIVWLGGRGGRLPPTSPPGAAIGRCRAVNPAPPPRGGPAPSTRAPQQLSAAPAATDGGSPPGRPASRSAPPCAWARRLLVLRAEAVPGARRPAEGGPGPRGAGVGWGHSALGWALYAHALP